MSHSLCAQPTPSPSRLCNSSSIPLPMQPPLSGGIYGATSSHPQSVLLTPSSRAGSSPMAQQQQQPTNTGAYLTQQQQQPSNAGTYLGGTSLVPGRPTSHSTTHPVAAALLSTQQRHATLPDRPGPMATLMSAMLAPSLQQQQQQFPQPSLQQQVQQQLVYEPAAVRQPISSPVLLSRSASPAMSPRVYAVDLSSSDARSPPHHPANLPASRAASPGGPPLPRQLPISPGLSHASCSASPAKQYINHSATPQPAPYQQLQPLHSSSQPHQPVSQQHSSRPVAAPLPSQREDRRERPLGSADSMESALSTCSAQTSGSTHYCLSDSSSSSDSDEVGSWGGPPRHPLPSLQSTLRNLAAGQGCVGLQNLGNTCFMNSILQAVNGVPELVAWFLSRDRTWPSKALVGGRAGLVITVQVRGGVMVDVEVIRSSTCCVSLIIL